MFGNRWNSTLSQPRWKNPLTKRSVPNEPPPTDALVAVKPPFISLSLVLYIVFTYLHTWGRTRVVQDWIFFVYMYICNCFLFVVWNAFARDFLAESSLSHAHGTVPAQHKTHQPCLAFSIVCLYATVTFFCGTAVPYRSISENRVSTSEIREMGRRGREGRKSVPFDAGVPEKKRSSFVFLPPFCPPSLMLCQTRI